MKKTISISIIMTTIIMICLIGLNYLFPNLAIHNNATGNFTGIFGVDSLLSFSSGYNSISYDKQMTPNWQILETDEQEPQITETYTYKNNIYSYTRIDNNVITKGQCIPELKFNLITILIEFIIIFSIIFSYKITRFLNNNSNKIN
jgi:hypothetical protein